MSARSVVLERPPVARHFYVPQLDGLRAIAFFLVFFAHAGLQHLVPGGLGVTVFFFLSGYLITSLLRLEWDRSGTVSLRRFYIRRALRLSPPLWIAIAFAGALELLHIIPGGGSVSGVIAGITYTFNYFKLSPWHHGGLPTGVGVVWSLAIEEHFYLIFPVVYLAFIAGRPQRVQGKRLVWACIAALLWRMVIVFVIHETYRGITEPLWTYNATDCRFDAILWGCILALRSNPWFDDDAPRLKARPGLWAMGGLVVICASLLVRNFAFRETLRYTLQSAAVYPVFFYVIARPQAWTVRWLTWLPLRWIGWVSYSLYLIHETFLLPLQGWYPGKDLLTGIVAFALAVTYAWLVRVLVEQRIQGLREKMRPPEVEVRVPAIAEELSTEKAS